MPVLIIQSKQFVQLYVTDKSQWVTIHGVPSGTHKQIVCSHFGHTLGKMHAFNRTYRCHVISHLTKYFFILNAAAFSAPTIPNMQWTCANGYRFRSIFDSFFFFLLSHLFAGARLWCCYFFQLTDTWQTWPNPAFMSLTQNLFNQTKMKCRIYWQYKCCS